jgi:chromosome segregation ATPase
MCQELQDKVSALEETLESTVEERDGFRLDIGELQRHVEELERQRYELESSAAEVHSLRMEKESLMEDLRRSNSTRDELQEQISRERRRTSEAEAREEVVRRLQKENEELRAQLKGSVYEVKQAERGNFTACQEKEEAQQRIVTLKSQLEEKRSQLQQDAICHAKTRKELEVEIAHRQQLEEVLEVSAPQRLQEFHVRDCRIPDRPWAPGAEVAQLRVEIMRLQGANEELRVRETSAQVEIAELSTKFNRAQRPGKTSTRGDEAENEPPVNAEDGAVAGRATCNRSPLQTLPLEPFHRSQVRSVEKDVKKRIGLIGGGIKKRT